MINTAARQTAEEFQLRETIALNHRVDRESVLLFETLEVFLAKLVDNFHTTNSKLITASPAVPEIAIACDRAEIECVNVSSATPFAADIRSIVDTINSNSDFVYLANPNRLTGATFSNLNLKELAESVDEGILIIDEYYADFSGLSSVALTGLLPNLVILKPFENWQSGHKRESGYAIISEELITLLDASLYENALSRKSAKKCLEIFDNRKNLSKQVAEIQKQTLEVATSLTGLGIKCRMTPTDFMVIHSDNAAATGKSLLAYDISTELVRLENYGTEFLIYKVTNPEKNKNLTQALMKILTVAPTHRKRVTLTV